jgi:hypothetical protein
MSRRNQPYIPLYADDFQTDEKLVMCSAESTGVFIRIMCLMHKSEPYGKILLKQKFKQTGKQILDFASQLAIYFPYDTTTIERALTELVEEDVLQMDGDFLVQKRMVRDAEISEIRGNVGKQGGKKSAEKRKSQTDSDTSFALDFAQAKSQPNTGIGIGIGNEVGIVNENGLSVIEKKETAIAPRNVPHETIHTYFSEIGFPNEAAKFIDYYAANGWKVGRNAMKDWQATARNWCRRAQPASGTQMLNRKQTMNDAREIFNETIALIEASKNQNQ